MLNLRRNIKSVEDHKFIDIVRLAGYEWETYEITEQLNGIDFEFWLYRDGDIRMASQDRFVDYAYHNCGQVGEMYRSALRRLKSYNSTLDAVEIVIVCGNLIGSDISQEPYYGPQLDFVAFDLVFFENGRYQYVVPSKGRAILSEAGILTAPRIATTSCLQNALTYDYTGDSRIPYLTGFFVKCSKWWCNPPWGLVIRPYLRNIWLPNGRQVILKDRFYRDRPTINRRYWVKEHALESAA